MTSVVKMVFENTDTGKRMTWAIPDPKVGLIQSEVMTAMMSAITNEVVVIDGDYDVIEPYEAYIYNTEKIELA